MTPAQIAAQPTTRSWGSTINGITSKQRKFLISMLRVPECRTAHLAETFGMTNEGAWQQLHRLRSAGLVTYRRKKNVGWWSIKDREGAIAMAMLQHAKLSRDKGGMGQKRKLPNLPTDSMDRDVFARRMRIVETIKAHPDGIAAHDLRQAHPDMNGGDTAWLRPRGYFHTVRRPSNRDQVSEVVFYSGPKPEVTR